MDMPRSDTKYLLAEFIDLNFQVNSILKSATRIKYTCFDVSQQFIIFGSTSGGVYIFNRQPCQFLQLIPNQTGPITQVSISYNEDWIAFSCTNGLVYVVRRRSNILSLSPDTQISYEHEGNAVTALKWDLQNAQLFVGDDSGRVSVFNLYYIIGKKILHTTSFLLLELKNPIVQLDTSEELLLVSSITKTVLCNTQRHVFQQVGLRPRHGKFGACFMSSKSLGSIYCARPGQRLWEVDLNGSVICTHKFRYSSQTPERVISAKEDKLNEIEAYSGDAHIQDNNFNKLYPINNKLIVTYSSDVIQIMNPSNCEIVLRTEDFSNIASCIVSNNIIYVFTKKQSFHEIHLMSIEELIAKCFYLQLYSLSSFLSHEYEEYLIQRIKEGNTISYFHSIENYELKYKIKSILCKLLNYKAEESTKDNTFNEEEILFKRDRRKPLKQKKVEMKLKLDNIVNMKDYSLPDCFEDKAAICTIEQDLIIDNSSSLNSETVISETSPESGIVVDVNSQDICSLQSDKVEVQSIPVSSVVCIETTFTTDAQTEKFSSNEILLPSDFAGQDQHMNDLDSQDDTDMNVAQVIAEAQEENIFANENIVEDQEIVDDLDFVHLGESDLKQSHVMKTDILDDDTISTSDIKFANGIDLPVMKLLYGIIKETREKQCTVPEKLPILVDYDSIAIVDIFKNLYNYILYKEGDCYKYADYECSKLFLQFVTLRLDILDSIENIQEYLIHSVIAVESERSRTCVCGYPMPQQILKPLFYGLCKKVYNLLSNDLNKRIDLCGKIPYLWHLIIDNEKDPSVNILSLIMQLDYKKGFDILSKTFTEEDYMNVIDYKITLHSKRCLLCFSKLEDDLLSNELTSYNISWNYVGNCMYRKFGGTKTLNMLINKSNEIPKGSLDLEFYHFLMLNP